MLQFTEENDIPMAITEHLVYNHSVFEQKMKDYHPE
jgi:hypothetical protein